MCKKIIAIMLGLTMVFGLTACSSDSEDAVASYPEEPIELIVPWSAGGVADLAARVIATAANDYLAEPIAVVNQAGASGTLAATQYVQEDADGYTLLLLSTPVITMQPYAREVTYSWDDYEPIIGLQQMEQFLMVNADDESMDTLEEFIEVAQTTTLSFGTNGPGTPDHTYATALMEILDVEFNLVIYDDAISVQNAILGGHIDVGVGNMGNFEEHVKADSLALLGTFSEESIYLEDIGEIESLTEQGIELAGSLTYFLVARAGTDEAIIDQLYEVFAQCLEDETFVEFIESRGLTVIDRNPEELDAYILEEIETVSAYFE